MIALAVDFEIKQGCIGAFRAAVLEQAGNSLAKEPGCRQFDVAFDAESEHHVFLYEVYDDEAAVDAHRGTPHFVTFHATIAPLITERKVRQFEIASPWPPAKSRQK